MYYVRRFRGLGTAGPGAFLLHDTWGPGWGTWRLSDATARGSISPVSVLTLVPELVLAISWDVTCTRPLHVAWDFSQRGGLRVASQLTR